MNYQIITDENLLRDFIDNFLPKTEENEKYYFCLFARKKYCKDVKYVKSDKSQLNRKTADSMRLFWKIKQMECPLGTYRQFQDEQPIPQEALALYINPNPRCVWKATLQGLSVLAKNIETGNKNHNPHQEMMSCIQRSCSRKIWAVFDIDSKDPEMLVKADEALQGHKECRKILETRGGYHVLVKLDTIPDEIKRTWYQKLAAISDVTGDTLIPVPGSYQGGWTPRFLDI